MSGGRPPCSLDDLLGQQSARCREEIPAASAKGQADHGHPSRRADSAGEWKGPVPLLAIRLEVGDVLGLLPFVLAPLVDGRDDLRLVGSIKAAMFAYLVLIALATA